MSLFMSGVLYHLSCPSCGKDWWIPNGFPKHCPFCRSSIELKTLSEGELQDNDIYSDLLSKKDGL